MTNLTHFVELVSASFLIWCFVISACPWSIARVGYVRALVILLIVLGMEMLQPRPLEVIAAVGAVAVAYAVVDR